jgi:cytochrome P450
MSTIRIAVDEAPYFNISDPSFAMHSDEVREARKKSWFARTNYGYAVLRYKEVTELLKSPSLSQGSAQWPDHHGVHSGVFHDWWSKNLLVLEGEEHHRIRRLLNPAFSPTAAKKLEPAFAELAEELIANFIDQGECEFVSDFSEPFATRALCIMLDIPHSDWEFIADRGNIIGYALGVTIKEDIERIDQAVTDLYEYVEKLIDERTKNPGDDVVSRLIQFTEAGDKLTPEELRNAIVLMLFGGMDTTRNQIGLIMNVFINHPAQWELLAEHPELARPAIEEAMRVAPTTTWVTREAIEDFEFQGLEISAGTTVHLFTYASGTDPEVFPGDEVDIAAEDREPHHTFGGGVHNCLGHYIARADMSVAMPILAKHLKNIQAAPGAKWLPDSGNTGPMSLPITFEKRS